MRSRATRQKKWDSLASPATLRRDDQVMLQIGATVLSRKYMRDVLKCDYYRAARALTKRYGRARVRDIVELCARTTMEQMWRKPGIAELGVRLVGNILIELGKNPDRWAKGTLKLSTRYNKVRRKYPKRPKRVRHTGGKVVDIRAAAR